MEKLQEAHSLTEAVLKSHVTPLPFSTERQNPSGSFICRAATVMSFFRDHFYKLKNIT